MKLIKELVCGATGMVLIMLMMDCLDVIHGWTGWQWFFGWGGCIVGLAAGMALIRVR